MREMLLQCSSQVQSKRCVVGRTHPHMSLGDTGYTRVHGVTDSSNQRRDGFPG